MYREDSEEACKGRYAEGIVKDCLMSVGWKIIPSSDYTGPMGRRAPRMVGEAGFVAALPDIDIAKSGVRRWVEVKFKDHRECFRKWGRRAVHGIALRSFQFYQTIQEETGTPVWLFVVEGKTNDILTAPLDRLEAPAFHQVYQGENENDPGGSIYFDVNAFELFGIVPGRGEMFELKDYHWYPITKLMDKDKSNDPTQQRGPVQPSEVPGNHSGWR